MTKNSDTMKRSYSWLSLFCRYVGLVIEEEPVLPINSPNSGSGARSPVGFPLDSYGLSEAEAFPADKWPIQIERGQGSSSVFVHMGQKIRQRPGLIQHA